MSYFRIKYFIKRTTTPFISTPFPLSLRSSRFIGVAKIRNVKFLKKFLLFYLY